nr:autotransporter outer membrane beta-barrel domain-containing protein [Deinococcus budaensis]
MGALPAPALQVRLPGDRTELLAGRIDAADLEGAVLLSAQADEVTENAGAIKLPLAGSVIRLRDRITVVVEGPQGERPGLTVNGTPVGEDRLGTEVQDGVRGVQRLTYVGVPLRPGPNVLRVGTEEIKVVLAGATAGVEVTPLSLTADGSTPLRLRVRTFDAFGTPSGQSTLTVRPSLEPRTPDANPGEAGYQVRLEGGEGVLELQPQSAPTPLRLDVLLGEQVLTRRFEVTPGRSRVGVGVLSATLGLDGNLNLAEDLTWQARGYVETPLGPGKLYAAADKDGLPGTTDPTVRSPVYGDAGTEQIPLQGTDPVAAVYDHPGFRVAYRRSAVPIDVLPVGEGFTGLTAVTRSNPAVSGFVAGVPGDRVSEAEVTPDSTRILRLPDARLAPDSETLEVVTRERQTGKELERRPLVRNVDYLVDYPTGIVTLVRPLDRVDAAFNDVLVLASYRLSTATAGRTLAYGVQVKGEGENYTVGAAVVSLDGKTTFGVRGTYQNGPTRAETRLAFSGGVQASADLSTRLGDDSASFRIRYQDAGYVGLAPFAVGLNVGGNYTARLGQNLSAGVDGEYHDTPTAQGGSVTARADYRLAPFSVGGGLKYAFGDTSGLGAVLSAGYHRQPLDVDVTHTQPLSGNLDATTAFTVRSRLTDRVTLGLRDDVTWGKGHVAALTLDTRIGNTTYAAGYELPTASGEGNRARFGVSTTLPLSGRTTLGLRGSALYDVRGGETEVTASADLTHRADTFGVTAGTDLIYREGDFGTVLRAGITGSVTDHLTLTADGLAEFGLGKNGQRFSLGYAYRNSAVNSLGYVRLVQGSLAGGTPQLNTGVSAEYRQPTWAVRGGVDTRALLSDAGSFTAQAYLGGTAYLTDRFGVGAWGRVLTQPATNTTALGYGVEGSVRALPGTWLTAGYNFAGFEGLPSAGTYTKQGLYLRLDLTVDETLGGKK